MGRSYFLGGLLAGIWLIGALLVLDWCWLTQPPGGFVGAGLAAVLLAGVAAGIGWTQAPIGQMAWDGAVWRWESVYYQTGAAGYELSVLADFQRCLLLRLENQAGASLWLWAEARAAPARWLDLRRAVYSPHRSFPLVSSPASAVAVSTAMHPIQTPQAKP